MAGLTQVNVYRTPNLNAAGAQDMLVAYQVPVDIQPADEDPHERDSFPQMGAAAARLKTWWWVFCEQMPLPDVRPNDRVVDINETDSYINPQVPGLATYRVRRVKPWADHLELYCERDASLVTN